MIRGVQHKKVVCILDEAHLLEKETLEEFRFLLNYRFDSMSPMAVVLVGQTELWENKLKLQRYAAIRQRIDMYCTLPILIVLKNRTVYCKPHGLLRMQAGNTWDQGIG